MKADVTVRCPNCDGPLSMTKGVELVDGAVRPTVPDSCVWCKCLIRAVAVYEPFMLVPSGEEWLVVTKRSLDVVFRSPNKGAANAVWVSLNDIALQRPPLDFTGGRHE